MKKFMKIAAIVSVVLVFFGTFVFLYRKSQPEAVSYQILKAEVKDLRQTTVATGKIEPRDEVQRVCEATDGCSAEDLEGDEKGGLGSSLVIDEVASAA